MVPGPPPPWTISMLLMPCGTSFGIKLWESRMSALNILAGATAQVKSCEKWVMFCIPIPGAIKSAKYESKGLSR